MSSPTRYDDPSLCAANEAGTLTPTQQSQITSAYRGAVVSTLGAGLLALLIFAAIIVIFPAITALFGALFGLQATTLPITLKNGISFSLPCSGTLILIAVIVIALLVFRRSGGSIIRRVRTLNEDIGTLGDLSQHRVASADGLIVWRANAYHAQLSAYGVPGEAHDLRLGRAATLAFPPPGSYRFFYLPSAHILLSARPLASSEGAVLEAIQDATISPFDAAPAAEAHTLQAALAQALHFTLDDLAANRSGTLSPTQVSRLRRRAAKESWIALLISAVFIVGEIAYLRGASGPPDVKGALIVLAIGVGLMALYLYSRGRFLRDIAENRVVKVEGKVVPHVVHGNEEAESYYYSLPSASLRLSVDRTAYDALIAGPTYRMYYLGRSETILTIEPIADGQPTQSPPTPLWPPSASDMPGTPNW